MMCSNCAGSYEDPDRTVPPDENNDDERRWLNGGADLDHLDSDQEYQHWLEWLDSIPRLAAEHEAERVAERVVYESWLESRAEAGLVDYLTYCSYRHNRKTMQPEQLRCVFGDAVDKLERRLQQEGGVK